MTIQRIAAFSHGDTGGNPAGVLISPSHPPVDKMRAIAAEVGFSETAFSAPDADGAWRVRYFSPQSEVPFCGHATIALGSALTRQFGPGTYRLILNNSNITVEGSEDGGLYTAALQSPPTRSRPADADTLQKVLTLFGFAEDQIDYRIPPAIVHGGADHFSLTLTSREALASMAYDQEAGRRLMEDHGWVTIMLAYSESPQQFHTRNAFASGGVYEDPATGAASAAFAGYLRDIDWPHGGRIEISQGADMGMPSQIHAEIGDEKSGSIRVSGTARIMQDR
ncbi:PhzF family phenazine biosynthesis protein [Roseibium denhamense]|uniref:Phenazine biosynthesis protein PhzF family n=1 Tax=Roseibium denhamense TaxID=76305 RepID=A0ABY1NQP2_9HYPH|nr:PhzF family phenazine biosynthesis protein [Roseibium denhamense]MTI07996.1 PhzF family phenazine biosynthesis protein [Roseibium denhamense]SMP15568.1 phenazine biosynthesis protein PhzF family [Roseibium denhamense]